MLVYQFEFEASVYYSKVFTHKTVLQLRMFATNEKVLKFFF